ncbi:relaxase/mobilization nuclease domain-containing protein [Pseudomonas juntendi]|uniref:relaxase/mobilization nuclease domain-containing protein n=1 Tax=Pseudomonas juntendi TaxID=2666183 RepID=UPI001E41F9A5|nr:relaxase/mobilization nuclease domain-containing protein [Pseudomonas juntendi]
MIRKVLSKLPDSNAAGRAMNYATKKAALIGGSEAKFENTSIEEFNKLGMKKFDQVNNKYENKKGRKQEVTAIHEMISFDKSDKLTPEQALEYAMSVWRETIDIDNRKYRYAVHTDTDEMHVHLIWNKRNNKGEIYNKKDDYRLFEKCCYETELKHGLKHPANRKYLQPELPTNPQSSNEYRHEKKGFKSEKSKFKDDVLQATDAALTASEFLQLLDLGGYSILVNAALAYSIEKDGQVFKASDVGASYKSLKQRFGEDLDFPDTLARLGKKTAPKREFGGLSGPQFAPIDDEVTKEEKAKKSRKTLYTRFDSDDGKFFFFKDSPRKAFSYESGTVTFNSMTPTAIKAGLQKMVEVCEKKNDKEIFVTSDIRSFKRETWIQFEMMGLAEKGYKLNGFEPNQLDHIELRKRRSEFEGTFSTGNSSIANVSNVKNPFDKLNESAQKMKEIEEMKKENEEKRKHVSNTRRNAMKPRL